MRSYWVCRTDRFKAPSLSQKSCDVQAPCEDLSLNMWAQQFCWVKPSTESDDVQLLVRSALQLVFSLCETWNKPSAFLADNETPASVSYSCTQAYICLKSNWMMSAEAALNAGHCCSSLTCFVFMALWLPDLTVLAVSLQRHGSDEEAGMWWHQDQLPWRAASPAGVGQTGNPHQPGVCAGLSGTSWIRTHTLSSHSS